MRTVILPLVLLMTMTLNALDAKTPKVYPSKAKEYILKSDIQSIYFLARFVDVDMKVRGTNRMTMLTFAIVSGKTEVAMYLISKGANLNKKHLGQTPLEWAVIKNNAELAGFILENDTHQMNNEELNSLLAISINYQHKQTQEVILKHLSPKTQDSEVAVE